HVRRTVDATMRSLGVPRPRYRDARLVPSYLMLVEANSDDDVAVLWALRLAREDIEVDVRRIIFTDGEPRVVRLGTAKEDRGIPLEALPTPPYGQRLIVVSDGAWMADEKDGRTPFALRGRFARWPRRVLFTPLEPRRWGPREAAIEEPERSDDPGFLLL